MQGVGFIPSATKKKKKKPKVKTKARNYKAFRAGGISWL
jgi:hypothetical protein